MDIRKRIKATAQKNTLLKNAQANAASNFFKRVFFSATQENFFPTLPFLIKLFSPTHGLTANTTSCASNVNRFGQSVYNLGTTALRTDRRASANSGFKKLAVQWLNEHLCFVSSSVLADNFVLRNRQLLKPTNVAGKYQTGYRETVILTKLRIKFK
jgi:hypothetical protein